MRRAFLLVGRSDPRFQERDRRLAEHLLSRLTALLLARKDEIGHPDPAFAIAFGMELVMGVLRNRYVLGLYRERLVPPAPGGLVPELVRAYCSYLGLVPPVVATEAAAAAVPGG